jgi:hypothetical protein
MYALHACNTTSDSSDTHTCDDKLLVVHVEVMLNAVMNVTCHHLVTRLLLMLQLIVHCLHKVPVDTNSSSSIAVCV